MLNLISDQFFTYLPNRKQFKSQGHSSKYLVFKLILFKRYFEERGCPYFMELEYLFAIIIKYNFIVKIIAILLLFYFFAVYCLVGRNSCLVFGASGCCSFDFRWHCVPSSRIINPDFEFPFPSPWHPFLDIPNWQHLLAPPTPPGITHHFWGFVSFWMTWRARRRPS